MQSRFRERRLLGIGMVRSASANKLEFGPELLVEPCKLLELAQIKGGSSNLNLELVSSRMCSLII